MKVIKVICENISRPCVTTSIGLRRRLRVVYSRATPMITPLIAKNFCAWPCALDIWPFNIEQLCYMAGHMTNLATKYEDHRTIRSWVTSYNGSQWLPSKTRTRPLRMRRIRVKNNYIFVIADPDLFDHYATYIGLRRRLRVVYSRAAQC